MVAEEKVITEREFLENWPLYREASLSESWDLPATISRDCPTCKKETTWTLRAKDYLGSNFSFSPQILDYRCELCKAHHVVFLLSHRNQRLMKVGQFPPLSTKIPKNIETRLGPSSELYWKALVCRNQGFGVGALAYFRRVVEEKTNELIDVVAELAEAHGIGQADVEKLRSAKNEKTYDQKIRVAAPVVPKSLMPDGVNPLATLYSLLSEGLHARTEEECLQIVDDMRDVFEHVFGTLRAQIENQKQFVTKVQRLAGRQGRKP